ncbi:MAG: phosphate ABC transporter permease PstA [Nitrospinae bacterium]|jgi:phosphate transport system permease protein|nr:phosphate ABC transporter permease PstA [Nitrospinota bacterium]
MILDNLLEKMVQGLLGLLTLFTISILILILGAVLWKGAPALDWEFLSQASTNFGAGGGIFYQMAGTLLLMAGAVIVSLPVALGAALFQTEYLKSERLKKFFRNLIHSLNGMPTILFGLLGYMIFGVTLETGVSWLTGVLILAVMILPTLQVSFQQAVETLPEKYRDAGMALGLSPWAMIRSVIIPQSLFGIVTGVLLGLARAAGETAAIMFTATTFSGILLPRTWTDPVPTLQSHILILAQEALNPEAVAHAWGAGLVLLSLALLLIAGALFCRSRMLMESER